MTAGRSWSYSTQRRRPSGATGSGCRPPAAGSSCSTATPRSTGAAAWATRAASKPNLDRATVNGELTEYIEATPEDAQLANRLAAEVLVDAIRAAIPAGLLDLLQRQSRGQRRRASGGRGGPKAKSRRRGRPVGVKGCDAPGNERLNVLAGPPSFLRLLGARAADIDHRIDAHTLGARDLTTAMSARIAAERGLDRGEIHLAVEQSELAHITPLTLVSVQTREGKPRIHLVERLGLGGGQAANEISEHAVDISPDRIEGKSAARSR